MSTKQGNIMPNFDKKEQLKFVTKIHDSLIRSNIRGLMSLFLKKDELSLFFKKLEPNRDIGDEIFEKSREKAKDKARNLLNYINNHIEDFSSSEIVDVEA